MNICLIVIWFWFQNKFVSWFGMKNEGVNMMDRQKNMDIIDSGGDGNNIRSQKS